MDIEKIRTLIALMEESELVNLEISSDDEHISLTRHYDAPTPTMMAAPTASAALLLLKENLRKKRVASKTRQWLVFSIQRQVLTTHHL